MFYSNKVLDYYENLCNVGLFVKDDDMVGMGMVGVLVCGDVMKLQICVGVDGVIEDVKFKIYGCGLVIVLSLFVIEWVKGKMFDEVLLIKNMQIVEEFVLLLVKIYCLIFVEDVIKVVVVDYKKCYDIKEGDQVVV